MKTKRYPNYKQSGIDWLGEIPSHWQVKRLKHLGDAITGLTYSPEDVVGEGEGSLVLRSSNVQNGIIDLKDTVYVSTNIPPKLRTKIGDILICSRNGSRALIGKSAVIDKNSAEQTFGAFMTIFRSEISPFLKWVLKSKLFEFQSSSFLTSTINQLTLGNLNNMEVPVPPLSEQQTIADFLDRETAKIDSLITSQQTLVERLKEKRLSVVSHAVTCGIQPRAEMRSSSFEWLGDVPKDWKVLPLKRVVSVPITDGPHETPNFIDDGIPFVSAEAVSSGRIDFSKVRACISIEDNARYSRKYSPKLHDIYMVKSGATTGITAIVEGKLDFNIWSPLAAIRCGHQMIPHFLLHFMRSRQFFDAVSLYWSFGTQQNIGMGVIQNLACTVPPLSEQVEIVEHLDTAVAQFDELIDSAQRVIELLKERRSALITAAVTGQIEVAANLTSEVAA